MGGERGGTKTANHRNQLPYPIKKNEEKKNQKKKKGEKKIFPTESGAKGKNLGGKIRNRAQEE